ncbi:MAG TPA: outer membrane protein assembly factor BamD [Candidatus Kapabacteria bacterium]
MNFRTYFFLIPVLALLAWNCGSSSDELTKTPVLGTGDQLFAQGKASFTKEDYPEAIRYFEEVRVQAPASSIAAEATYLEALSRFNQESYAGAAVDFRAVHRNYPTSPFAERAEYMVGESYYQISPRPELDQSYTILALSEFQNFLHDYPGGSSAAGSSISHLTTIIDSAQARVLEIRTRLAQKYLLAAQLYDKLEDRKAETVYLRRVLDNYYDTPPAIEAELRLAEVNFQRKKLDDARNDLDAFDSKYLPQATASQRSRAQRLHAQLTPVPQ